MRFGEAIAHYLIAAGIEGVPRALDRGRPVAAIWNDPALLLGQCCGYPLTTGYRDRLQYVATPRYLAAGCEGAAHRSVIIIRAEDQANSLSNCRDYRAAVNAPDSNTGHEPIPSGGRAVCARWRFFRDVIETGSHAESVRLVAAGEVDIARSTSSVMLIWSASSARR